MSDTIKLDESWRAPLLGEFESAYMQGLKRFLQEEKAQGKRIFPKGSEYFRALDLTPLDKVKVVVLGQDPYHGEGQAHGLCFSVKPSVRTPPSLVNIYKELQSDLGLKPPRHGFLEHWAGQGVLLLNSVLTVEMGKAASHQKRGWEQFTDAIIRQVNQKVEPVVFLLWGAYAQRKAEFVDGTRHLVLKAAHPSPFPRIMAFWAAAIFRRPTPFWTRKGAGRSTGACLKRCRCHEFRRSVAPLFRGAGRGCVDARRAGGGDRAYAGGFRAGDGWTTALCALVADVPAGRCARSG